jgi:hypothetical protein
MPAGLADALSRIDGAALVAAMLPMYPSTQRPSTGLSPCPPVHHATAPAARCGARSWRP